MDDGRLRDSPQGVSRRRLGPSGGRFHMVQLWVNLPADHKMDPPRYQPLTTEQIGHLDLAGHAGTVRVIAGNYDGHEGPAVTYTQINLWDVALNAEAAIAPDIDVDDNVAVLVIDGNMTVNTIELSSGQLAVLDRSQPEHHGIELTTSSGGRALVMTGQPIGEPVAAHGPFVMNTPQQIVRRRPGLPSWALRPSRRLSEPSPTDPQTRDPNPVDGADPFRCLRDTTRVAGQDPATLGL